METKLMETSIYNAYVIEGDTVPGKVDGKTKRDFLSFTLHLAHKLVGDDRKTSDRRETPHCCQQHPIPPRSH